MIDRFGRKITYLRVSITNRCNFRCRYCMPKDGISLVGHEEILSFEEIKTIVKTACDMGITKVRLTGGEPLVRKGVVSLVEMLSEISGIEDFAMSTNGVLLPKYAKDLASAGLHRVNVSLDTMDKERFAYITRVGNIDDVLAGIDAALDAGLTPVKLNCVVDKSPEEPDALAVKKFATEKGIEVRFIRMMDTHAGEFSTVIGGSGGDCKHCNRLRVTSEGIVRPCLFSDKGYDVKKLGYKEALEKAVAEKPERGGACEDVQIGLIGG